MSFCYVYGVVHGRSPHNKKNVLWSLKKKFLNSPGVFLHVSLLLVFLFQFWRTTIIHVSSKSFYKTWAPPCTVWPSMAGVSSSETSTSGCAVWKPLLNGSRSWTTSRSPRYFYWNRRVGGPQNFQVLYSAIHVAPFVPAYELWLIDKLVQFTSWI